MSLPASRRWLTRNLVVLSLVSLTQDAASELMYPLMPLFLAGTLAAPAVVLGVVEGCAELAAGLTKLMAGISSDTRGRRTFITAGYGFAAVGKAVVAASVAWPTVLFGRVIDRVGKGLRSAPRDAMITTSTAPEDYARALGFHRSADTLGAVIGPVLALIGLSVLHGDVRAVMWWAIIPATLSVGLTFLVRDHTPAAPREPKQKLSLPRSFWVSAAPLIAIAMTNIPDTLLLLRLSQLGASTTQVVLAYVAYNAVYTLAAYPAGVLASSMAPRQVYALGLTTFGVVYITLGMIHTAGAAAFFVVAMYGLFPALTDGIGKTIVAQSTPPHMHGRAQGVYQSLQGGAILVAGTWAGAVWTAGHDHGQLPFLIAGIASLCGAAFIAIRHRDGTHMPTF